MAEAVEKAPRGKRKDLRQVSDPAVEPDLSIRVLPDRNEELVDTKNVVHTCLNIYNDIERGFEDQSLRANIIADNWDCFDCKLTGKQFYNGNSKIFVPLIRDAVNARVTRFSNQIFPQGGRFVDVTTEDGQLPYALMALTEYYIGRSKLRTEVIPALLRSGDVEGQYSIYVGWRKTRRHVAWKTDRTATIMGEGGGDLPVPGFKVEDIQETTVVDEGPYAEIISDTDLVVLPPTSNSIEEALEHGGSVTVIRRWGKARIQNLIDEGEIDEKRGKALIKEMSSASKENMPNKKDVGKIMLDAAGIKRDGRGTYALVYETWVRLVLPEGKRLCRVYFAGRDRVLSVRRCPYWNDRVPVISCPVVKVSGSFKGFAPVSAAIDFNVLANDACNEGMDSAAYALLPIVMTDPEKNPRVGSMIMSLAAIWECSPSDTQFAQFPPIWKDSLEIIATARQQVFQTLGINPSNITQAVGKKKLNQAEIAQEQQIDMLTTADQVTIIEQGVLTPLLNRFIELDHQFREDEITIREFGEIGQRAKMERVPPLQFNKKWQFRWYGVEQARTAQQIQQQISMLNVLRGVPPNMYQGYQIDLVPAITQMISAAFGPRLAPLIFKDRRSAFAENPDGENAYMSQGVKLPAHQLDDHQRHMMSHAKALQGGDPWGYIRLHMAEHQMMMNEQLQQMMAQQQAQQPGGGKMGPQQGPPQMGGQPAQGRPAQGPPGQIAPDRMIGTQAPRR